MAIVLIPGFMLDRDLWSDIAPALEVFGPLIHANPDAGDSIEDMARRTLQMAPDRFILIGFSMGGYVAREMARIAPERVSCLVLIATSARAESQMQAHRKCELAAAFRGTYRGVSRKAIRQSLAPDREKDVALVERVHAMSVQLGRETFQKQASFRRDGDAATLARIQCPVLIVAGKYDRLRSIEEAKELQSGIAGSQLTVLETGHMIPLEAPAELTNVLLHFIDEQAAQNFGTSSGGAAI